MRIAIVGAGVSGLGAAYALDPDHDVTIYEKDNRIGGHASTVDVDHYGPSIPVDTGFIIFNRFTYPNLTRLFRELHVKSVATKMAFSISLNDGRFEWATSNLNQIFAQRSNAFDPSFYVFLTEILRFYRVALADLEANSVGEVSFAEYLRRYKFGQEIIDRFLIPMGGSIWSATAKQFLEYPAEVLLGFMKNHQLLTVKQPIWLTVENGSRTYVERLVSSLRGTVHKGVGINKVRRGADGVTIVDERGNRATFDHAILACHSSDALNLLEVPTQAERDLLGAIRYDRNITVLHGDPALMPKRHHAWGSWNYIGSSSDRGREADAVGITYWMNALQHIDEKYPLFVTLNPRTPPKPELTFATFDYKHPQFDRAAINAQKRLHSIQGNGNVWFCGAYAGYGFHEDGFRSGLEVAHKISEQTAVPLLGHPRIFA